MKKGNGLVIFITLTLIFAGCNNYFHDLIPPNGNRIISFSVEGMIERAVITDNAVDALVDNESPLSSLIPKIKISPKATILPLTYEYLSAAFPNADILQESAAVYKARDLSEYVMDLIKRNPDFNVPAIKTPIDFSGPVNFLVISGQGAIRQYAVRVVKDTGEPRILGFGFSKYDNPELVRDSFTSVNQTAKTVNAAVLYPMEMYVSYALVPSFEIMGDRLEIDGAAIRSGVDSVQFTQALLGAQAKTLTVWRNGRSADYALTAVFSEDPDSIRSIVDFRFYKTANTGIAATAVGSIINNNALGTINAQVFYSGARPSALTPAFLSPGTVSVAGVTQVSGSSSHDFLQVMEYRVVSRNNLYTRVYTVVVDYIDVAAAAPVFTSFKFSSGLNHELVQDTESQISDSAGIIMITARYGGSYPPEMLIPEFRATGIVTVFGSVQTSGFSAQNFSVQIKYTVTNPENSLFKRDYWAQVTFIRDTSSAAQINSFSFHPDENPGLADELTGRIDQSAGTIIIFAPVGSGVTSRTMIPRFRAAGQVLVDDSVQISGASGMVFNAPVVYEAVSANGANRKAYTVTVRELQSTIFVSQHAYGHGDGASWADAFRELGAACEAAALFPDDVPKEIWIAAGTYKPQDYFPLTANTSYIGGFAGNETAKSQRNIAANKTVISGDLGGGAYASNLFGAFNGGTAATVNGDVSFENLEFTTARATGTGDRRNGGAINAALTAGFEMSVRNCSFNDVQANYGAMAYINGGKLVMSGVTENTLLQSSGAVYGVGLAGVEIDGIKLRDITDYGLYFSGCSGDIEISDVDLQGITGDGLYFANCPGNIAISGVDLRNISGDGISITGGSGRRELSGVTGSMISGDYGVYVYGGNGDITLADSDFDSCAVSFDSGGFPVRITGTTVKNISGDAIYANGGSTVIENVVVENVTYGSGMDIHYNGTFRVSGSAIKNLQQYLSLVEGGGIMLRGSGSAVISNTVIENINGWYDYDSGDLFFVINANMDGDLTIIDSTIKDVNLNTVSLNGSAIKLTGSGNTVISNTTIKNITAGRNGSAIYAQNRNLVIADTTMDNITAMYGVWGTGLTGVGISDLALRDIDYGLYFYDCSGDIEIDNIDLQNISNYAIYIDGGSGKRELSNITGNRISGTYGVYVSGGSGDITLAESNFDTVGRIVLSSNSASINISDTTTKNVSGETAFYIRGRNIVIERVNVENVPNGRGINMEATGTGRITGSSIKNCAVANGLSGGGIYLNGLGGNVTISSTTIEDVEASGSGGAIYTTIYSGDLTITGSTIKNATATSSGGGIYYEGSGIVTISGTTIEDVEASLSGGGIYVGDNALQMNISNTTIKNATVTSSGGGIYYAGSGSVTISGTTIENVENTEADWLNGGAIYVNTGDLTITNSTIKNAKSTGGPGGGIHYRGSGSLVISDTTIENVSTSSTGGAIYVWATASQMNISNTTIKNARAYDLGGGLSYQADKPFVITGSRFENCRADRQGGAIFISRPDVSYEITNTTFLNCTARNGQKFINTSYTDPARFSGCTFEDDDELYIYDAPTVDAVNRMFGYCAKVVFENCTFNNLRGSQANGNFIFTALREYYNESYFAGAAEMGWNVSVYAQNITLRNCTFNFEAGSAGLCALYGDGRGVPADYLLMDGVTINNNGGQTPLIWLDKTSTTSILQVNPNNANNRYNTTPLNDTMAIMGLYSSGVIKLTNGAMPGLAP